MHEASQTTASVPIDSIDSVDGFYEPLTGLLHDLSETQSALLDVLTRKRELLARGDRDGLAAIQPEEEELAGRLSQCQQRRQDLLDVAQQQGLPRRDLKSLAEAMPRSERDTLRPQIRAARARSRLLQHQSLANWVLVQRTLLHLSQMIEIVATGGEKPPTYQERGSSASSGVLMDRAV